MVDVQETRVRAFEQDRLLRRQTIVEQIRGVGDVAGQPAPQRVVLVAQRIRVERAHRDVEGRQLLAADGADHPQLPQQSVAVEQLAHPDRRRAVHLVGIGGADPPARGTDREVRSLGRDGPGQDAFEGGVVLLVIGHDHVGPVGDAQIVPDLDPPVAQPVDLLDQNGRVDDDAIGDHAELLRVENARGDEVHGVSFLAHDHGVAGVGPAVVADDDVVLGRQQVDDLALALVAPLQADDGRVTAAGLLGWHLRWLPGGVRSPEQATEREGGRQTRSIGDPVLPSRYRPEGRRVRVSGSLQPGRDRPDIHADERRLADPLPQPAVPGHPGRAG